MMENLSVITNEDWIIHCGDFGFYLNREKHNLDRFFIPFENAVTKILLIGNHDKRNKYTKQLPWTQVVERFVLKLDSPDLLIHAAHHPTNPNLFVGAKPDIIIHGHVHEKMPLFRWEDGILWVNVSVEATGYRPIPITEIIDSYEKNRDFI